jgi:hypothetical protein
MKTFLLLATLPLLASCAATVRAPASAEADSQSVELASRLRGGSLKFRAYRDGNEISVLGFLELKFKNCEAKLNAEFENPGASESLNASHVDCTAELNSDPVHEEVHVQLVGDKRKFTAKVTVEKSENFSLQVHVDLVWENKNWKGTGNVTGWLNQRLGNDTTIAAHVRESLAF